MDGVPLKHNKSEAKFITEHCIISQKNAKTTSSENGRHKMIEVDNRVGEDKDN